MLAIFKDQQSLNTALLTFMKYVFGGLELEPWRKN